MDVKCCPYCGESVKGTSAICMNWDCIQKEVRRIEGINALPLDDTKLLLEKILIALDKIVIILERNEKVGYIDANEDYPPDEDET